MCGCVKGEVAVYVLLAEMLKMITVGEITQIYTYITSDIDLPLRKNIGNSRQYTYHQNINGQVQGV